MRKKYRFDYSPRTKPFPHQVEAIEFIASRENIPLFDEQGLGKTKIVIEALCNNMEQGIIDGVLVICKKHLIDNWKDEIETHSYLKYIVLRGRPNEKGMKFMGYSHFYLINYESVIGELKRLKMFLKIRDMAIVLDESHRIKNPNGKTTKAILELREFAKKRIIITGTPMSDYKEFEKTYSVTLKDCDLASNEERFSDLRDILLSSSIRRLKDDVLELPEKVYIDKYVQMEGQQERIYTQVKKELYIEVTNMDGERIIDESRDLLKRLLRLVQIASNPFLIDKAYNETPAKFYLLDGLVKDILGRKEKLIVWSSFVENIRILRKRYKEYGSLLLYGGVPIEQRNKIVKQFIKDDQSRVLIANPAAAKEGLTLTSANNAIYVDRNFNMVDYLQSQDRIHRLSQTKECKIYKLIADNTIDEYIDEIVYKKHKLAEYVQGDASNIVRDKAFLTKEQLLEILGK